MSLNHEYVFLFSVHYSMNAVEVNNIYLNKEASCNIWRCWSNETVFGTESSQHEWTEQGGT